MKITQFIINFAPPLDLNNSIFYNKQNFNYSKIGGL